MLPDGLDHFGLILLRLQRQYGFNQVESAEKERVIGRLRFGQFYEEKPGEVNEADLLPSSASI